MKSREMEIAKAFGIAERISEIEQDLLKVEFVKSVEFDLFGFYDNLNQVIILVKYDIPVRKVSYFKDRRNLVASVVEKAWAHGLAKTRDRIEYYGEHFYFVFEITDKAIFYGNKENHQ